MQNSCNKNVTILCRNLNMQVMEVSVENKKLSIVSDVLNLTTFVSLYEWLIILKLLKWANYSLYFELKKEWYELKSKII